MAAGSIVVDLLMRTGSFETDTKRAEKRLQQMKKEALAVGKAIGAAFATVTVATAALVKSAINSADQMRKLAQASGTTTEALSALTFAAQLNGVSQDELGQSLQRLSRTAAEAAKGGNRAAQAFDAIGVSVKNTDGTLKTSDKLLSDVAEKFAQYADGAEKTALAQELFGRSGAKLIPLLNQGAAGLGELKKEAAALGLVIDDQTGAAAEQFNDTLTRLNAVGKGLANRIAADLLPTLNRMAAELFKGAKGSETLDRAARAASAGLRILLSGGALIVGVFQTIGQAIGGLAASLVALFSGRFRDAFNIASETVFDFGKNVRGTASTIGSIWDAEADKIAGQAKTLGGKIAAPLLAAQEQAQRAGKRIADAAARAYEDVQKQLQALAREIALFGADETTTKLFDLQIAGATPEQLASAKALLGTLRELKEERSAGEKAAERQAAIERELKQIYDDTRTPIEKLNIELARLNELRNVAGADLDALARAEFDAWERYQSTIEETGKKLDQFAENAAKSLQSYLGDQLSKAFEGNFKDIGKGFTQLINRMVAEAIAANLVRAMFGDNKSGDSGWFGVALSAVGAAFGGAKAGGGDVMGGRGYLVGEQGPEYFVPRTAGTIVPNAAMGSQKQMNVTQTFHLAGPTDRRNQQQIAAFAARGLARASARDN